MFAIDGDYETPCTRTDPELFFSERKKDIEMAKMLCKVCRVQLICLEKRLEFEELQGGTTHGVVGGLTEQERRHTRLNRIA